MRKDKNMGGYDSTRRNERGLRGLKGVQSKNNNILFLSLSILPYVILSLMISTLGLVSK
jgi:hypothetical protein